MQQIELAVYRLLGACKYSISYHMIVSYAYR